MGIAVSGCGIGTFLFPPMTQFFINQYSWRGAFLLTGGLCMNLCVCGALMRQPTKQKKNRTAQVIIDKEIFHGETQVDTNDWPSSKEAGGMQFKTDTWSAIKEVEGMIENRNEHKSLEVSEVSEVSKQSKVDQKMAPETDKKVDETLPEKLTNNKNVALTQHLKYEVKSPSSEEVEALLLDKQSMQIDNYKVEYRNHEHAEFSFSRTDKNLEDTSTARQEYKILRNSLSHNWISQLNLPVFKNKNFLVLCLNNCLFLFGLSIVYVHLCAYAMSLGYSADQAAMLFSGLGVANFLGRIVFGLLAHIPQISSISLYTVAFFLTGILTVLCSCLVSYASLMIYAVLFGFLSASLGTLLSQLILDFVGLEQVASGYGYILVFEALGTLPGAPVAGKLIA